MSYFTCTIVGDGSSDRSLVPIIDWLLRQKTDLGFSLNFVCSQDMRTSDLSCKVQRALALYPCDILFVHRDAERSDYVEHRLREIEGAVPRGEFGMVPVIPIRMTEAWLLIDLLAVRRAANNPNGVVPLDFPQIRRIESLPDPKQTLFSLLKEASGLGQRRLRSFNEGRARLRVAELISDYSPLRSLSAFTHFEERLDAALRRLLPQPDAL